MLTIGVFDSGIGGLAVVKAIKKDLNNPVIFVNDQKNVPYGDKTPEQLYALVLPILQDLATKADVIVIACNTVTTTLVMRLRQVLDVPLVGLEPMVKPASQLTKTNNIAVCATPATLASERYAQLKDAYAQNVTVIEPDCSDWASMIETDTVSQEKIRQQVLTLCADGVDVIVLGCTHYHWIEEIIQKASEGKATVLQPELPVVAQLKKVLLQLQ